MVPPIGDQSELSVSGSENPTPSNHIQLDWTTQIDAEMAFRLVDSILPFEACLYHQILPLSLEGSRLKLGMVNMDDSAALDYVRRILAYMNCSLVPQPLASDVHYAALSAYLNYSDQQKKAVSPASQPVARRIAKKLAEHSAKRAVEAQSDRPADLHSNPTLVVDSPSELPLLSVEGKTGPLSKTDNPIAIEPTPEVPPLLVIHPRYLSKPPEFLADLPPHELLEELLGRVLSWGIGRLYLEHKAKYGRIVWSQNGVVQAVLEELPLDTFLGVIQALKQLTQTPLVPVQKPKQIEVDRLYQNETLLLRLRLMPNKQGAEEATLQILRGEALRFYRQQQLVNLGQEALSIAQQFQQKISEIYHYSRSHSVPFPNHLSILPELDRTLKRLSYQLTEIQALKFEDPSAQEE
ncbi:GSPII E family protein [Leptolyngbyaceae cyanobacterium JSC-12]|nr:GSPII E family protein [Leptolyngbyaceae cyanobacterium JSC-12]